MSQEAADKTTGASRWRGSCTRPRSYIDSRIPEWQTATDHWNTQTEPATPNGQLCIKAPIFGSFCIAENGYEIRAKLCALLLPFRRQIDKRKRRAVSTRNSKIRQSHSAELLTRGLVKMIGRDIRSLRARFLKLRTRHQTRTLGTRRISRPFELLQVRRIRALRPWMSYSPKMGRKKFSKPPPPRGKENANVQCIRSTQAINTRYQLDECTVRKYRIRETTSMRERRQLFPPWHSRNGCRNIYSFSHNGARYSYSGGQEGKTSSLSIDRGTNITIF